LFDGAGLEKAGARGTLSKSVAAIAIDACFVDTRILNSIALASLLITMSRLAQTQALLETSVNARSMANARSLAKGTSANARQVHSGKTFDATSADTLGGGTSGVSSAETSDASYAEASAAASDGALVNTSRASSSSEAAYDETSAETSGAAFNTSRVNSSEAAGSDETSAKSAVQTSAKTADGTSAKTTEVTSASACLCISGKKAAGKRRTCQNHHHSPSHDISFGMDGTLIWNGWIRPPWALSDAGVSWENKCRRRHALKMGRPVCRLN
jgi:hypothetical protein